MTTENTEYRIAGAPISGGAHPQTQRTQEKH